MSNNKKIKAVILAAGEGKRLAPMTEAQPKPLLPLCGKPLLEHTIEMLKENDITEILLIVGYLQNQIREYFKDGSKWGVNISYIEQDQFLGTAHATGLSAPFIGDSAFFLIYGDLVIAPEIIKDVRREYLKDSECHYLTALEVKDPKKYGILKINYQSYLERIVEKPQDDRYGRLANAGVYLFNSSIFKGISNTKKSERGEYELTESIERCLEANEKVKVLNISTHFWSDVGHPWQFLDANKYLVDRAVKLFREKEKSNKKVSIDKNNNISTNNFSNDFSQYTQADINKKNSFLPDPIIHNLGGYIEPFVMIHGFVRIGKNSIIKSGTYIEGPVIIGDNCVIGPRAYLRPYATIGNGSKIGNACEIKNSIIMEKTAISHLSYIGDSIIGKNVNIGCGTITANVRLDKSNIRMMIKGQLSHTGHRKLGAFIGDNVSLGIQVSIMPGKKIGSNCFIGSHSLIIEDIPRDSTYYVEQNTKQKIRLISNNSNSNPNNSNIH